MAAMPTPGHMRVTVNDYPEHLNPFYEDDHHNKIRFWTLGRKTSRSNSFSLSGLKDLRNTWTLKSFMKKGKKGYDTEEKRKQPLSNGEGSPVVYRRALEYSQQRQQPSSRSTVAAIGGASGGAGGAAGGSPDRYVYGGSVTPLPRSRFQERMRCSSQLEVNGLRSGTPERASFSHRGGAAYALPGLAKSDITSSRLSVESTNPFDETCPVRASRRKKKRAPPPPPNGAITSSHTVHSFNLNSSTVSEEEQSKILKGNDDKDPTIDDPSLNIELKIVEDTDLKKENIINITKDANEGSDFKAQVSADDQEKEKPEIQTTEQKTIENKSAKSAIDSQERHNTVENNNTPSPIKHLESDQTINNNNEPSTTDNKINESPVFERVNIKQYRRNSSLNEDNIRWRDVNFEDKNQLENKRCKSLTNTINSDNHLTSYDIALHIDENANTDKDINENTPQQPQIVICKVYEGNKPRKASIDTSISSTEKEFMEIDKATRELEIEINKLNSNVQLIDDTNVNSRHSFAEIRSRFDNANINSPNPIPKPRRTRVESPSLHIE